jgi:hypothetical protein
MAELCVATPFRHFYNVIANMGKHKWQEATVVVPLWTDIWNAKARVVAQTKNVGVWRLRVVAGWSTESDRPQSLIV